MVKKEIFIVADYTETKPLTLDELCEIFHFNRDTVADLVRFEIIHPSGNVPDQWIFEVDELERVKKALRLRRDFEVNLEGIALVLDLLEEMEDLRTRISFLEKHYLR